LNSREFNGGAFFKSPSGEMFFGGISGFNAFIPEKIEDNPFVPPVVLTSFRKLNEEVDFGTPLTELDVITLHHSDYFFSFEFASLDYTAPDENMYAYKMEGLDEKWIMTTASKRYASYTTLRGRIYVPCHRLKQRRGLEQGRRVRQGDHHSRLLAELVVPVWHSPGSVRHRARHLRRRLKTERMRTELRAPTTLR